MGTDIIFRRRLPKYINPFVSASIFTSKTMAAIFVFNTFLFYVLGDAAILGSSRYWTEHTKLYKQRNILWNWRFLDSHYFRPARKILFSSNFTVSVTVILYNSFPILVFRCSNDLKIFSLLQAYFTSEKTWFMGRVENWMEPGSK